MKKRIIMYLPILFICNAHALNRYIDFSVNSESNRNLTYTVRAAPGSFCMYPPGVYSPSVAHVKYSIDDKYAVLGMHYKATFLTKCGDHQSYQKLVITEDQNPQIKAYVTWIKPVSNDAWLKTTNDPHHLVCNSSTEHDPTYLTPTLYVILGAANKCG